jgi:hypothetical protein
MGVKEPPTMKTIAVIGSGKLHERRKQINSLPWYKRLRLWFKVDFVFWWIDFTSRRERRKIERKNRIK